MESYIEGTDPTVSHRCPRLASFQTVLCENGVWALKEDRHDGIPFTIDDILFCPFCGEHL